MKGLKTIVWGSLVAGSLLMVGDAVFAVRSDRISGRYRETAQNCTEIIASWQGTDNERGRFHRGGRHGFPRMNCTRISVEERVDAKLRGTEPRYVRIYEKSRKIGEN